MSGGGLKQQKFTDMLLDARVLSTNDDRLPTNDDRLATSNDRLATNDDRLATNDDQLPTTDDRKASFYQQAIELPSVSV